MMRFAAPFWLGLIAAGVVTVILWWCRRRWQRFPFPFSSRGGRPTMAFTVLSGFLAAMAFVPLALSLARPQEVLSKRLERAKGVDLVVALDVSGSMAALDFRPTDRLGVAKEVIGSFLDGRIHDRFGLVAFAGAAVTLCPLTLDHDVAHHMLEKLELGVLPDGTAIGLGLGIAVNRLRTSDAESKVVILVTDGSNNTGQIDPMTAADLAVESDVTVHTVLVGKGGDVPMPVTYLDPRTGREIRRIQEVRVETNPQLLAEIARKTGGTSFEARNSGGLEVVFAEIDAMERTEFTSTKLVRYRERFEPFAFLALIFLLVAVIGEGLIGGTSW